MPGAVRVGEAEGRFRSSVYALDWALDYLRERPLRVLPSYLVGMIPFSTAVLFMIDTITSQYRAALPIGAGMLTAATFWRWGWVARAQSLVREDLVGEKGIPLRGRLPAILFTKLVCSVGMTWGSFLIFPPFYAFLLSGFATPLFLEGEGHPIAQLRKAIGWISKAAGRLGKLLFAMFIIFVLGLLIASIAQMVLVHTVLPSILGLDTADLSLTLGSGAWGLSVYYFLFVLLDLYWTVTSVMLFYDVRARRLGSDLRLRLQQLREDRA